jgi:hypothetical protein
MCKQYNFTLLGYTLAELKSYNSLAKNQFYDPIQNLSSLKFTLLTNITLSDSLPTT